MDSERTIQALRTELKAYQTQLAQVTREKEHLEATTKHLNFLDNAIDGYFFTNSRNEVLYVNLYLLRMLGYSDIDRHALIGEALPPLHWQNLDDATHILEVVKEDGYLRDYKVEMNALNGNPLLVSVSAVSARDANGVNVGIQYTLRLLPQRSGRGTAELRAENRELAALTAIGRHVLSTMSLEEVVHHLMQTVLDFFEVKAAWVYLKQKDGTKRLAAHQGLDPFQLRNVQATVDDFFELRNLTTAGRPRLVSTRNSKTGMLIARGLGISNLAIAPLIAHEETIGMLVIGSSSHRFLIENDMHSLERIAQYAGLALSNAMLYDDLQQAYEKLKQAQVQLVDAERQKVAVEMAGAAAHELNQPLTVLLGYSNLLGRMLKDDDPQKPIYEKIERSTRKISEVVERLSKITRYRTRHYVEGQPIVDIEAASTPDHDDPAHPPKKPNPTPRDDAP